jgi:hypothetical protein
MIRHQKELKRFRNNLKVGDDVRIKYAEEYYYGTVTLIKCKRDKVMVKLKVPILSRDTVYRKLNEIYKP